MIVVDGDAPEGTRAARGGRGLEPGLRRRGGGRAGQPDDVLTLIYTSGTTGPPKGVQLSHHAIMFARQGDRGDHPDRGRVVGVISWLPAAHIAERNAAPLHPDRSTPATITCAPEPARGPVLPAAGPPDVVLRGAADLGEAQGRARGDAGGPARGAAQAGPGGARASIERVRLQPARRAGARRARGAGRAGRRADVLEAARDARARPGRRGQRRRRADAGRGARVLPRARDRARRAVGDVGDVRVRHRQPAGARQDRDGRTAVAGSRAEARRRRRGARAAASS